MGDRRTDLLQGTLGLMVLKTLELEPLHGLGVARRIEQVTRGAFRPTPGSLFPALHRLEDEGFVRGEWGESENRRRARYYRLTAAGRKRLGAEQRSWERVAQAMARLLESA